MKTHQLFYILPAKIFGIQSSYRRFHFLFTNIEFRIFQNSNFVAKETSKLFFAFLVIVLLRLARKLSSVKNFVQICATLFWSFPTYLRFPPINREPFVFRQSETLPQSIGNQDILESCTSFCSWTHVKLYNFLIIFLHILHKHFYNLQI